jgi:hypothetical protein
MYNWLKIMLIEVFVTDVWKSEENREKLQERQTVQGRGLNLGLHESDARNCDVR